MKLKLMYITNDEKIAEIAENNDVDWIFIDLEILGKEARQRHIDSVISRHCIEDIKKIKASLKKSELLVRVNPIYEGSKDEIDKVIDGGADIVMLPFFKSSKEVEIFIKYVNGRAKVCLLLETPEAVNNIDSILAVNGIDYVYIGLNDLHIGYGMKFMFELLADGTVEKICNKIKEKGKPYGFGGIARIGQGDLPAEYIIAEHYRLGSTMVILSRSFLNTEKVGSIQEIEEVFSKGVKAIRDYEIQLEQKDKEFFERNKKISEYKIQAIKNHTVDDYEQVVDNRGL